MSVHNNPSTTKRKPESFQTDTGELTQPSTPEAPSTPQAVSQLALPKIAKVADLLNPTTPVSNEPLFLTTTVAQNSNNPTEALFIPSVVAKKKNAKKKTNKPPGASSKEIDIANLMLPMAMKNAKGLYDLGKYQEAITALELVAHASTLDINYYVLLGYTFKGLGDHSRALYYYDQALTLNPKPEQAAELYYAKAVCIWDKEAFSQGVNLTKLLATEQINKALVLPGISDSMKSKLNQLLLAIDSSSNEKEKEKLVFSKLVEGEKFYKLHKYEVAVSIFQEGVHLIKDAPAKISAAADLYKSLGEAHLALKNIGSCIAAWKGCISCETRLNIKVGMIQRLALLYTENGQLEEAVKLVLNAISSKLPYLETGILISFLVKLLSDNNQSEYAHILLKTIIVDVEQNFSDDIKLQSCIELGAIYYKLKNYDYFNGIMEMGLSLTDAEASTKAQYATINGVGLEAQAQEADAKDQKTEAKKLHSYAIASFQFALQFDISGKTKGYLHLQIARAQLQCGFIADAAASCSLGLSLEPDENTKAALTKLAESLEPKKL